MNTTPPPVGVPRFESGAGASGLMPEKPKGEKDMFYLWAVNVNGSTVARFFRKEQAEEVARLVVAQLNREQNEKNDFSEIRVSVDFC